MSKGKELAKNTVIIFIGTICTKMVTFLLLPLYTGILSTDEYGAYDLIVTIVSLAFPIVTFQIEQAVFRELIDYRKNEEEKKNIISSSIACVLFQCLVGTIIFFVASFFINSNYKYYLLINIYTSIFSSLFLQISRGVGNNKLFAKGSFVSAAVTVLFSVLFLVTFNMKVEGLLLGTIIGQLICTIYLFFALHLSKYVSRKNTKTAVTKKMLKYSLPLVPNALSWWVFSSSDRFIVSIFLGLSMNGILAAATKISSFYTILYNVFDRSWIESIALHFHEKDIKEYFNKTLNIILKMFASLSMLAIAAMPFIYNIFIDDKFNEGYKLVPILLVAALLNVVQGLIVSVYAAKKDTKSIAKTSLAAAIINIAVHLGLIKFIGIYAAVVSTLCSYLVIAIYRYIDIRKRYLKIEIDKKMTLISVVIFSYIIYSYYLNNTMLNIVTLAITVIVSVIYNRHTLNFVRGLLIGRKKGASNE